MVSDTFFSSADKAAIIAVLQFPPAVLREYKIVRIKRTTVYQGVCTNS